MVVWVQLKHGYESIRAGKNFTHICLMVPGLSRHLFTHSIGLFLSQYSSILTPSSPAERRQIRQKSSPWEDKTVEERRKRKQSNCFLATRPFPGKMRSCISAAVEKAQARCGVQCQCIDSQDRMCAQEVSKPRSAAAQKRLWGSFFSSTWMLQAVKLKQHRQSGRIWHP